MTIDTLGYELPADSYSREGRVLFDSAGISMEGYHGDNTHISMRVTSSILNSESDEAENWEPLGYCHGREGFKQAPSHKMGTEIMEPRPRTLELCYTQNQIYPTVRLP